ncbi:cache domain-containing sensor histidine kinase [Paenibacillus sinopodophylli]|uniref:cache domain-containing sensor histidine kinase n=1 Tax=Paenibacillus sinopodophylli TaxID=1837342 RepID=UPI00110CF040|nr:sensor histidine kinase [Paenibacillus sinopodophylli]
MKVRRIRNKIMGSVILIVTFSITLISVLALERFSSILEAQAMKENVVLLNQTADRMDQFIEDVQLYSANMVNDEVLQQFVRTKQYHSVFDEIQAYHNVVVQLTKFNVLRNYLASSAIIRPDGKVFWSSLYVDPYFERELSKGWFQNAINTGKKSGFTEPHVLLDNKAQKVISFFIRFDPAIGGVLLLNIKFEAISGLLDALQPSFDRYAWSRSDGAWLLNHQMPEDLNTEASSSALTHAVVHKTRDGYYLTRSFHKTDWSVVTFTSKGRFYRLLVYVVQYWAIFLALCLTLCALMFLPIISNITRPISQMSKAMKQVSMGNYNIQLKFRSNDELEVLRTGFQTMVKDIETQMEERVEQEKTKRRMSTELLFAQMNPHFIYNTLNTVVYLSRKNNQQAVEEMVESFIGILHDAVKLGEKGLYVTVSQERVLIDHYTKIQKYRYADRFNLVWRTGAGLEDQLIPKSVLQPLIENAIFHGFAERETSGLIEVNIEEQDSRILLTVKDDGMGIEPEIVEQINTGTLPNTSRHSGGMKHIGMANIRERLTYLYGDSAWFEVDSREGEGTSIRITLPLKPEITD